MNTSNIGKHAGHSAFVLGIRQVFVHAVNITGGIILARILMPADFGVFAIFTFLVTLFSMLCDLGLGASLIQQSGKPEKSKIDAVVTFQLSIALLLTAVVWFAAPAIIQLYHQNSLGISQLRVLSLLLIFNVFLSINTAQLERSLAFSRLSIIEIGLSVIYQGVMVFCAFRGLGVWSFVFGSIARNCIGAISLSIASGYLPRLTWNFGLIKPNIRFGLFYQSNGFVSLFKDSIVPTFVGLLLGAASVGYIGWAGLLAGYPLLLISALNRIYLPFFSRLASDKDQLAKLLEKILAWSNRIVAPLTATIIIFCYPITLNIYKSDWLPAVPLMVLFCLGNIFSASSGPCLGLLNALGKPERTLVYTSLWAILNWLFGIPLIKLFGLAGFGIANLLVGFSNIFLFLECRKHVSFKHGSIVFIPWVIAAAVGCLFYGLNTWHPIQSVAILVLYGAGFVATYSITLFIIQKNQITQDMRFFIQKKGIA